MEDAGKLGDGPVDGAFSRLLSPFQLRHLTLRNRVQVTSHGTYNVDENCNADAREAAYWRERAKGGAGLCIMGTHLVHPSSPFNIGQFKNYGDEAIPGLRAVADAVHEHGSVIFAQIGHMGQRVLEKQDCIGPSAISWHGRMVGVTPRAMTLDEIHEVIEAYGQTAARVIEAGLDGIELAVGHGQLINTFLSPVTNQRDDDYGGSPENRMRFCLEVIESIRRHIGPEPIMGFRINGTDRTPGGLGDDDWLAIARQLDALGAGDYFNVSIDFTGSIIPTCLEPNAMFMPWAARIREAVSLPVFSTGRITDPEMAEEALASGAVDVVGMTRGHIADPEIVAKITSGRRDDIRPCIGCLQMCVGEVWRARNVKCVYNPVTGREMTRTTRIDPAPTPRRVTIVGAGPAGLEAARVAALRGHTVTVLEKSGATGGAFARYATGSARGEFARATTWLAAQATKAGADIRLNTDADTNSIAATNPEAILLATGAVAVNPDWAGSSPHLPVRDLLDRPEDHPGRITIVDSAYGAGLVAGVTLADAGRNVRVIAAGATLAPEMEFNMRDDLIKRARALGVEIVTGAAITGAATTPDGIDLSVEIDGKAQVLACEVLATTDTAPRGALPDLGVRCPVRPIGDAAQPGRLEHAIEAAYLAAMAIGADHEIETPATA